MNHIIFFSILLVVVLFFSLWAAWENDMKSVITCITLSILFIACLMGSYKKYIKIKVPTLNKQMAEYDLEQAKLKVEQLEQNINESNN